MTAALMSSSVVVPTAAAITSLGNKLDSIVSKFQANKEAELSLQFQAVKTALQHYGGHIHGCTGNPCHCGWVDTTQRFDL